MIGDIVLQKRSGWVGWFVSLFTRNDYVHVGIDIGEVDDLVTVAHVDWSGKQYTPLAEWGEDIIVLRPNITLDEEDQIILNVKLLQAIFLTEVRGYDFFNAVKSWLWKNTDDEKSNGRRYHCAEFVSAMYRKGIGIDLVTWRSDDTTQPQDFLESPYLRRA